MSSRGYREKFALVLILGLSQAGCLTGSGSGSGWTPADSNGDSGGQNGISLAITSPTSAPAMETSDADITLGGTASSASGIAQVSWSNNRGGQGNASGTDSWQTSNIALELGTNTITVSASDLNGNTRSREVVVTRESGEPGSVTLSWTPPTTRADGSPLRNLAGYKIYFGRMSSTYDHEIDIRNAGIASYVIENLVSGKWYFTMTAYDGQGVESRRSGEVSYRVS